MIIVWCIKYIGIVIERNELLRNENVYREQKSVEGFQSRTRSDHRLFWSDVTPQMCKNIKRSNHDLGPRLMSSEGKKDLSAKISLIVILFSLIVWKIRFKWKDKIGESYELLKRPLFISNIGGVFLQ